MLPVETIDPILHAEEKDGVRLRYGLCFGMDDGEDADAGVCSWNVFSANKIDGARMVVPLGVIYTPLKQQYTPPVHYDPVSCKGCRAILNPFW